MPSSVIFVTTDEGVIPETSRLKLYLALSNALQTKNKPVFYSLIHSTDYKLTST